MNTFLYLVKFIAFISVIIIHTRFPGALGKVIDAYARFAVPFFFSVSGRFLVPYHIREANDIRKKVFYSLKKILKVTILCYSVYLIYSFIFHVFYEISPLEWFDSKFNLSELKIFLLFNSGKFIYDGSYTFDHMWYLFALIYVYVLIIIFAGVLRKWYKWLTVGLLGLLYFGELLQTYYPIRPFDISITTWYILRNWLLMGMPFVLLGIWFSDYISELSERLSKKEFFQKRCLFMKKGVVFLLAGLILCPTEVLFFDKKECPLGALFIVVGILFLSESGISGGKYLWKIGKDASASIYLYHVLIISVIDILSSRGVICIIPMALKHFVIIFICIIVFYFLPKVIKEKRSKNE